MVKILRCALLITMIFSNQLLANGFEDFKSNLFRDLLYETNYKIMERLYNFAHHTSAVQLAYKDIEKYLQQITRTLEKDTQIAATALVSCAKGGTLDQQDPNFQPCVKFMNDAEALFPSLLYMLKKQVIPPYSVIGIQWLFCCCKGTKPQIKDMKEKITDCVRFIDDNLAELVREFSILFQRQHEIIVVEICRVYGKELLYGNNINSILMENAGNPAVIFQKTNELLDEKFREIKLRSKLAIELLSHLPRIIADPKNTRPPACSIL